jgi:hypothetical protein
MTPSNIAARIERCDSQRPSPPNILIGGPVRIPPGFPLKACGNDGLVGELGEFKDILHFHPL